MESTVAFVGQFWDSMLEGGYQGPTKLGVSSRSHLLDGSFTSR